jgi:excinuclease ABC subunit C
MNSQDTRKKMSKLPDSSGVYFFIKRKKILYIGKATSLRDRVRSYFGGKIEETRGPLISKMLSQFDDIKYQKTDSVLEALILEANLIKKHQPPANTTDKDDKSFNYVVITREDFPRVLVMRERELEAVKMKEFILVAKFGPFTNNGQLKEAIKIVRKMFPFRDKCEPLQKRACFNRQIGLCPGVCTGEISKGDYAKQIKNIVLFFEGKKKILIKKMEKQMKEFAKTREFEKAGKIKKTIFALNHIQDVSLIKDNYKKESSNGFRIESYDIAHLSGTNVVGVMTVVENGEIKKSDYRKFKIRNNPSVNDTKALNEVLTRRLNHPEWPMPNLIVVDGGVAQKRVMEKVLKQNNLNIPVAAVVKDEKHKPKGIMASISFGKYEKEILLANAEAHRFAIGFHRHLRGKLR